MTASRSEADAVVERYRRREAGDLYSMLRPEVMLSSQERQRGLLSLLRRHAPAPLQTLRVLEVGCGMGGNLVELIQLGFDPSNLVGAELLPDRAETARQRLPAHLKIYDGDALGLDIEPASFDIVYVSVVFSSLLDDAFQKRLATTMWRWVRPGGAVLWYDFIYDNPANKDVRGVSLRRVRSLFPQGEVFTKRVTLAPPISRRVCRVHPFAYHLFNCISMLRTHVLCWIGKSSRA
jgi:SAM-dependent methyltransferase